MSRKKGGPGPNPPPKRYAIVLTKAAERGLERLPRAVLRRVDAKILTLADDPHPPGSKKLVGQHEINRVRVGSYRILYQVDDDRLTVLVIAVGKRGDIYRRP
jgi:mRNA interferase RelE/StbE